MGRIRGNGTGGRALAMLVGMMLMGVLNTQGAEGTPAPEEEKVLPPGTTLQFTLLPEEEPAVLIRCTGGAFLHESLFQGRMEDDEEEEARAEGAMEKHRLKISGTLVPLDGARARLEYTVQSLYQGRGEKHAVKLASSVTLDFDQPLLLGRLDDRVVMVLMLSDMPEEKLPRHDEGDEWENGGDEEEPGGEEMRAEKGNNNRPAPHREIF